MEVTNVVKDRSEPVLPVGTNSRTLKDDSQTEHPAEPLRRCHLASVDLRALGQLLGWPGLGVSPSSPTPTIAFSNRVSLTRSLRKIKGRDSPRLCGQHPDMEVDQEG